MKTPWGKPLCVVYVLWIWKQWPCFRARTVGQTLVSIKCSSNLVMYVGFLLGWFEVFLCFKVFYLFKIYLIWGLDLCQYRFSQTHCFKKSYWICWEILWCCTMYCGSWKVVHVIFILPCLEGGGLQAKAEQEARVGKLPKILWKITQNSVSTQVMSASEGNSGRPSSIL